MALTLNQIDRAHISDTVLKELLDQLISGALKVGDRLPSDAEIAEQIGAGRNSVREAMKVLQVLGFIERRQGDGSYVSAGGSNAFEILLFALIARIQEPHELVELRKVFEVGVVELLISRISDARIAELDALSARIEKLQERDPFPLDEAVACDIDFHMAIVESTGNQALMALANVIMRMVQRSMKNHLSDREGFSDAVRGHKDTLEALKKRDRKGAIEEINRSFDIWQKFIRI